MYAVCVDVRYEAGSFELNTGVTRGVRGWSDGNSHFENRGTGWGQTTTGSKLILRVKLDTGNFADIWIDQYFKQNIGKLTENRRNLIKSYMPQSVEVYPMEKKDCSIYFKVADSDLIAWHNRIKPYLK